MFSISDTLYNPFVIPCSYDGGIYGDAIGFTIMLVVIVVFVGLFLYGIFKEYGANRYFLRNMWREYLNK